MFVPVACPRCGKPFQVPAADAGKDVACPWCAAVVAALPVAGPVSSPLGADAPGSPGQAPARRDQPGPISLDDETPSAPKRGFPFRTALGVLVLVLAVFAVTVLVLGYGAGRVPGWAWREFSPPDGSCTVSLPGEPQPEPLPPPADGPGLGGTRYSTHGWYSGVRTWVAWRDLDPGWAKQLAADRDAALLRPVLEKERDRTRERVGGTVTREGVVRFGDHQGIQVEMDTPRGKLIERLLVVPAGPRPRLYVLGVEGRTITPASPVVGRVFGSFRTHP
jgi:hypothetical protein